MIYSKSLRDILAILAKWRKDLLELLLSYVDPSAASEEPAVMVLSKMSVVRSPDNSLRQLRPIQPRLQKDNSNNNNSSNSNNNNNNRTT